ncbi:MAG: hypothetical protein DMF69_08710, partial [Acidobacteria bacterium]
HILEPVIAKVPDGAGHETSGEEPKLLSAPPQETDAAPAIHPLSESTSATGHAVHSAEEISAERLLALLSVMIALAGIGIGWVVFQKRPLLQMPSVLENKYYVDEIYDATLINPITAISREGLWKIVDQGVIDGILHSIGEAVTEAGRLLRYMQAGLVRGYAAIILFGALVLVGVFAYFSHVFTR